MVYKLTEDQIRTVVENGSERLANYCMSGNLHYMVTGSSGGLDSAVTLGFARRACKIAETQNFNLTSVALILPCDSEPEDAEKGLAVAKKFGARTIMFNLDSVFKHFMLGLASPLDGHIGAILGKTNGQEVCDNWNWSQKVAQGNIKARLRMISLYHAAKMFNGIVLSTDNLSEYWMAFWTIGGDVGDFNIIQNILKANELYDIARYLGVPEATINSPPGDGLKVGGSAADQLGGPYSLIEKIMINLIQRGFNPDGSFAQLKRLPSLEGTDQLLVEKIARRCLRGAYKRCGTITIPREELGLPDIKDIQL